MNDEWEDVPADDFEDAPASDEWEDVDTSMDQGPPLSAANPLEEFHPSASQASALGWTSGVPGLQPAAAAIRSGIDSFSTKRKLLDDYQMQRERLRRMDAAASTEHPGAYYGANIPANVATAIAAGAAVPAKVAAAFAGGRVLPTLGRLLGNAGLSVAQEASDGTLDAEHVGRDVLAAEGANIMLKGALKPVQMVAKGSQVPQKIANAFYRLAGRGAAKAVPSSIDGDDLASRLARAAQRGEADLGPNGFTVPAKEFADDIATASQKAKDEAVRMHAPDRVLASDPVTNMRHESKEIRDALTKRKDELEKAIAKFPDDSVDMDMASYRGPPPIPGRKIPQSPVRGNARDFDPDTGPLVRNTATKAESKGRWGDADKPEGWSKRWKKNTSGDVQGDELRAEYLRKHSHESNVNAKPPTGKPAGTAEDADVLDKTADKISQRTRENRDIDFDQTMTKARGKVSEAAKHNLEELKRVRAEREAAGRSRVRTGGAVAGAVTGFAKGGPVGAVLGHLAGERGTRATMRAIDKIGDSGKKLEAVKSWAEKLAAKDTPMGRTAREALNRDYDGFIRRMSVLVDKWD